MSRQEEILDGLYDSRLSVRCFCSGNLSGAGTGQVVDRMSCYLSRSPGDSSLDIGNGRCSRILPENRF